MIILQLIINKQDFDGLTIKRGKKVEDFIFHVFTNDSISKDLPSSLIKTILNSLTPTALKIYQSGYITIQELLNLIYKRINIDINRLSIWKLKFYIKGNQKNVFVSLNSLDLIGGDIKINNVYNIIELKYKINKSILEIYLCRFFDKDDNYIY